MASQGTTKHTYTFDGLFYPEGPSNYIYQFIPNYERVGLASSCKQCLHAFIQYLLTSPKDMQMQFKSMALRHFLIAKWQSSISGLYPLSVLHELKKIGTVLFPPASTEFVGRARKAYYEADIETLKILISFGLDASKLMGDVLSIPKYSQHVVNPKVLRAVLSSPAIALNANYYRSTYPLALAAIYLDKFEIWEALTHFEIDWNYTDKKGRNLAYWSACCHSANRMRFLSVCHSKHVDMDKKDHNGNRACSVVVCHGKFEAFKYLVEECKVDLNAQNDSGVTVVHEICERSRVEMLKFAVAHKARFDIQNKNGETAVDYARMYYSEDIANVLREHGLWDQKK